MKAICLSYTTLWLFLIFTLVHRVCSNSTMPSMNFTAINESHPVFYIFSHGLADTAQQAEDYRKAGILGDHYVSFDYYDSCNYQEEVHPYSSIGLVNMVLSKVRSTWYKIVRGNYNKTSLAQRVEIERLKECYDTIIHECANAHIQEFSIVLVGVSRGASTIIPFLAQYKPAHIAAVILESPFDSIASVVAHKLEQLRLQHYVSVDTGQSIVEFLFKQYRRDGIQPIDCITQIDDTIPILIICSRHDSLIPHTSSTLLHEKLQHVGHKKSHLLVTDVGNHGKILNSDAQQQYIDEVRNFYEQHNVPFASARSVNHHHNHV